MSMRNFCFWSVCSIAVGCVTQFDRDRLDVQEADRYAEDGLLREAADKYRAIIAENSSNSWAKRNMGLVQLRMRDYSAAIANLEAVSERFSQDFEVNYALAESYRVSEKFPQAIFRYQRSLEISPNDSRATKGLAWSYYRLHYYPEALASIRQYRKKSGEIEDGHAAVIEARILARLDRHEDALGVLRTAKQELVDKSTLAFILSAEGEILVARGDCPSANKVFRDALKRQPLLASSLLGLGKCFVQDGKPELAVEYLERAIRIKPSLTEGYLLLAQALKDSDKIRAAKYFKKFRQLAMNDPEWLDQVKSAAAKLNLSDEPEGKKSKR